MVVSFNPPFISASSHFLGDRPIFSPPPAVRPQTSGFILVKLASGNLLHNYWKLHIETVDLPNLKMVIFHSYVSLTESMQFDRSIASCK